MGGEKPCTARRRAALHGITPAWAGKSKISRLPRQRHRDHPRVGGEKDAFSSSKEIVQGSPPRGRGKVLLLIAGNPQKGITPAWAGKSCTPLYGISGVRDHPRVGGEKRRKFSYLWKQSGSPPRGRGKVDALNVPTAGTGITPAWAGKSMKLENLIDALEDHPRVGGEKGTAEPDREPCGGSPPRGRGKGIYHSFLSPSTRITPAWAGKSQ